MNGKKQMKYNNNNEKKSEYRLQHLNSICLLFNGAIRATYVSMQHEQMP